MWISNYSGLIFLKKLFFLHLVASFLCQRSVDYICVGLFLASLFSSADLFVHCSPVTCCFDCCLSLICVQLFATLMDAPGSSVHGIFQARILEWVAISFSRGSSQPRDQAHIICIAGRFFTAKPPGKPTVLITIALK